MGKSFWGNYPKEPRGTLPTIVLDHILIGTLHPIILPMPDSGNPPIWRHFLHALFLPSFSTPTPHHSGSPGSRGVWWVFRNGLQ